MFCLALHIVRICSTKQDRVRWSAPRSFLFLLIASKVCPKLPEIVAPFLAELLGVWEHASAHVEEMIVRGPIFALMQTRPAETQ